jgi:peroxiredoxin
MCKVFWTGWRLRGDKDTVASHKKFEEKYGLAFTLLADPERKVIEVYDVRNV